MRLYFPHPVNVYDTPLEGAIITFALSQIPGAEIENPNQPYHQVGYTKYAERAKLASTQHKGMNYFFDEVLPTCGGCVSLPFLDGRMGLGVAGETKWYVERDLWAWMIHPERVLSKADLEDFAKNPREGFWHIAPITVAEAELLRSGDPLLVVPHVETRLRTWVIYNKERRPYEAAHLLPPVVPEGFYPDGSK